MSSRPLNRVTSSCQEPAEAAPVAFSNPKKRKREESVYCASDAIVWELNDEEILASCFEKWTSAAYDHYTISVIRNAGGSDKMKWISFKFACKYGNPEHSPVIRARLNTKNGTTSLRTSADICNTKRNALAAISKSEHSISYSEAAHRAVIALRCARDKRPFNFVTDKYYIAEVGMLRPGTKLPSPDTVAKDVRRIYAGLSVQVRDYFKNRGRNIHLAIDGWTAPTSSSYLGVVIIWSDAGSIHRVILEFIRLVPL